MIIGNYKQCAIALLDGKHPLINQAMPHPTDARVPNLAFFNHSS
ncbi:MULTISPECIES: hypothetical protein [unclassified Calothrix]|nr:MULTISPECIES: hypothetical protein [unclassified Calothrix]